MPDASSWGVIAAFLSGAGLEALRSGLSSRQARRLRRSEREIQLDDRQVQFEIDTLLQLEEAVAKLVRMATRTHIENLKEFRDTARYGYAQLPDEIGGESSVSINREVSKLASRVIDDGVRAHVEKVRDLVARLAMTRFASDDGKEGAAAVESALNALMGATSETFKEIGQKLRELYMKR